MSVAIAGFVVVWTAGQQVHAQGFDGADLEERVAELEATTARKGNRKVSLQISGHVNQSIMFWDDGHEQNAYVVEPGDETARFNLSGSARIIGDIIARYNIELHVSNANSSEVDAQNDDGELNNQSIGLRRSSFYLHSGTWGGITLGLDSSASDNIDYSKLHLRHGFFSGAAREISNPRVTEWNANFALRWSDGSTVGLRWGDVAPGANIDHERPANGAPAGTRGNLIRYDSPDVAGFVLSGAYGEDDFWDGAIRYAGEFGGFRVAAGIGYAENTDETNFSPNVPPVDGVKTTTTTGSATIWHVPTGLFVTGTYGEMEIKNPQPSRREDTFAYVKFGSKMNFTGMGMTTFYGEYYYGQIDMAQGENLNPAAAAALGGTTLSETELDVWGLGVVQRISDAGLELYLAYRHYEAELMLDEGQFTSDAEDMDIIISGARIKF